MDKKNSSPKQRSRLRSRRRAPSPAAHGDEEHKGGNYMFALKVLAILVAIILVIVILQASGVPVAIRDWFREVTDQIAGAPFPFL